MKSFKNWLLLHSKLSRRRLASSDIKNIFKSKWGDHLHNHQVSVPDHQVLHHLHQPDHITPRMSKGYNQNPNLRFNTSAIEGINLGEMEKAWKNLAASEMRLQMMDTLIRYKVGFNDIEYFNLFIESLRN